MSKIKTKTQVEVDTEILQARLDDLDELVGNIQCSMVVGVCGPDGDIQTIIRGERADVTLIERCIHMQVNEKIFQEITPMKKATLAEWAEADGEDDEESREA